MKRGKSAKVLHRKYTSVRYIPLKCSRKKIGSSPVIAYTTTILRHYIQSKLVYHYYPLK